MIVQLDNTVEFDSDVILKSLREIIRQDGRCDKVSCKKCIFSRYSCKESKSCCDSNFFKVGARNSISSARLLKAVALVEEIESIVKENADT